MKDQSSSRRYAYSRLLDGHGIHGKHGPLPHVPNCLFPTLPRMPQMRNGDGRGNTSPGDGWSVRGFRGFRGYFFMDLTVYDGQYSRKDTRLGRPPSRDLQFLSIGVSRKLRAMPSISPPGAQITNALTGSSPTTWCTTLSPVRTMPTIPGVKMCDSSLTM